MNEKRLAEIEARAKAATPGPWKDSRLGVRVYSDSVEKEATVCEMGVWTLPAENNAPFIAHARQDIPDLIEAFRSREADYKRTLGHYESCSCEKTAELAEKICETLGCSPEQVGTGIASDLASHVETMIVAFMEGQKDKWQKSL